MKTGYVLLMALMLPMLGLAQTDYWQQEVNYTIQATLNEKAHAVKGNVSLEYINHSPDTLRFVWFHLWPNAYKNDSTALAKQLATDKDIKKMGKKDPGYIDSISFKVNGQTAQTQLNDSGNIDIVKVILPQPLMPGGKIMIATPFSTKLPSYYSRSGYDGQQFIVCQWYPKPAVYDKTGWHPIPYLDQGEFYSEYGSFKVSITVPAEYVVGATGMLQNTAELNLYKQLGIENNKGTKEVKYKTTTPGKLKTLQYYGDHIHDFAWFASKDFIVRYDTLQWSANDSVLVFSYGQPGGNKYWKNSTSYIKDAVRHYSGWIGKYPYPVVQAVEGPGNVNSGGMEYPMITLITSPKADGEEMDGVITHEVGHNWFYGILGSNERDHPWMDEGVNTYFQFRYEAEKYRANSIFGESLPKDIRKLPENEFVDRVYYVLKNYLPAKRAINTPSTGFSNKEEYGIVIYVKTAIWLYLVENTVGRETLDKAIHSYYTDWQFRHPQPEDFKNELENASGKKLDDLFDLLNKEGNFQ